MPRKHLRQLLPRARRLVREHKLEHIFGKVLNHPDLWHLNRHSVAWAVSVGLFMSFVPVPFQMVLAAGAAVLIGCNLAISVCLVWISNPVTMPPMFFAAYKVGAWTLGVEPQVMAFEISLEWLLTKLGDIWQPFLLGCLMLGVGAAALGHAMVRLIWRIHVAQSWRERRERRRERRDARP